jgi:hypothetical protein
VLLLRRLDRDDVSSVSGWVELRRSVGVGARLVDMESLSRSAKRAKLDTFAFPPWKAGPPVLVLMVACLLGFQWFGWWVA